MPVLSCLRSGVNNHFLVATSHPIALTYNDISVLEGFHVADAFKLAMQMGVQGPFTALSHAAYEEMRSLVIEMVLATVRCNGGELRMPGERWCRCSRCSLHTGWLPLCACRIHLRIYVSSLPCAHESALWCKTGWTPCRAGWQQPR